MNEEEAIEYIEQFIGIKKEYKCKPIKVKTLNNTREAIETVLNLLEKKDRQLEEKTNRIRNLEKECQKYFDNMMDIIQDNCKKDKIIDLMGYAMTHEEVPQDEYCVFRNIDCEVVGGNKECKECIKQYFERKVENGN